MIALSWGAEEEIIRLWDGIRKSEGVFVSW